MSGLLYKVTHNNKEDTCIDCGASAIEKLNYICPGPAPEEGTFTKAILDEVKDFQTRMYCVCGGSSIREASHAHYCPCYYKNHK